MPLILTDCPACGSRLDDLEIIETYDVAPLGERVDVTFGICTACSFVCQTRVPDRETLMRYYQNSPKLRTGAPSASDAALYSEQAAFMLASGPLEGKRVLDVGADMGKLLDLLHADYGCATFYQEENETARAWLQAGGRHCEVADLRAAQAFDWIVLSQVLEHIVDPVPWLSQLRAAVVPGGRLFVEVPHHGLWDRLDLGFSFEHVNYFSPASLTAVLERAGFSCDRLVVTTDQRYFSGSCRIVRANAVVRTPESFADRAGAVRRHRNASGAARYAALDSLSRELVRDGRAGLAVYGAAELANQFFVHTGAHEGRIAAIFDSDRRKHGSTFAGHVVRPPSDIPVVAPETIVILSGAEVEIRRTIEASGFAGSIVAWSQL